MRFCEVAGPPEECPRHVGGRPFKRDCRPGPLGLDVILCNQQAKVHSTVCVFGSFTDPDQRSQGHAFYGECCRVVHATTAEIPSAHKVRQQSGDAYDDQVDGHDYIQ
jgi:hypothetical protein